MLELNRSKFKRTFVIIYAAVAAGTRWKENGTSIFQFIDYIFLIGNGWIVYNGGVKNRSTNTQLMVKWKFLYFFFYHFFQSKLNFGCPIDYIDYFPSLSHSLECVMNNLHNISIDFVIFCCVKLKFDICVYTMLRMSIKCWMILKYGGERLITNTHNYQWQY